MRSRTKIKLDLSRQNYDARVEAIQDDGQTRQVEAQLLDGGSPWEIPAGVTVAVAYQKSDGTKGLYDVLPDDSPAVTCQGSTVTLTLVRQMLSAPGMVRASVVFQDEALNQLTVFPFTVAVEANPAVGALPSVDHVRLTWLEEQLEQYLTQLKQSGVFDGDDGLTPTLVTDETTYQAGTSGESVPEGTWQSTVPAVPQGQFLWTRRVKQWSDCRPSTDYSVSYMGVDGAGDVRSVAGITPDGSGNVALEPGDIGAAALADLGAAAGWNLLDNSDFRTPVNQRGATSYTGTGYGIDRWSGMSRTSLAVGDGVVQLSNSAPSAGTAYWQQPIPEERLSQEDQQQTFTLAVKMDDEVAVHSGVLGTNLGFSHNGVSINALYSSAIGTYVFRITLPQNDAQTHALQWAALYPGAYTADTLPRYRPRGYAAELAECQRYYRVFSWLGGGQAPERVLLPLPMPMRGTDPAVSYTKLSGSGTVTVAMSGSDAVDITVSGESTSIRVAVDAQL